MTQILIETNECDYMTYFENASWLVEQSLKDYSKTIDVKEILESSVLMTKASMKLTVDHHSDSSYSDVDSMIENDFEVYVGADIPLNYDGNGSHVMINLSDKITLTNKEGW